MGQCEWWGVFLGRGDSKSEGREEGKHVGSLRNTKLSFEDGRGPMMDSKDGEKGAKSSLGTNTTLRNLVFIYKK